MSIILKGIDLPERDGETIVIHYADKYGEPVAVFVDESDIIEIPKDHGRIIDEREAIRGWCKGCAFNDGTCGKDETICEDKEMCKYAPTILEAEE